MSSVVVDASALLAVMKNEPGGEVVASVLDDSAISAVNLAEVVTRVCDDGMDEVQARALLSRYPCETITFDETQAWDAGMLRTHTRSSGLSLGDRACLALGRALGLPVLTADRSWRNLHVGIEIRLIR